MTMRLNRTIRIASALVAALVSAVIWWSTLVPMFVTGTSAPLPIWGPAVDERLIAVVLTVCVLGILLAPSWRWRTAVVLFWLGALAVLTHRMVDGQDYGPTSDQWLGLEVARLGVGREVDPEPARCAIGPIPALCITRRGHPLQTPTVVPFAPMVERGDGSGRLTAGLRAQ